MSIALPMLLNRLVGREWSLTAKHRLWNLRGLRQRSKIKFPRCFSVSEYNRLRAEGFVSGCRYMLSSETRRTRHGNLRKCEKLTFICGSGANGRRGNLKSCVNLRFESVLPHQSHQSNAALPGQLRSRQNAPCQWLSSFLILYKNFYIIYM